MVALNSLYSPITDGWVAHPLNVLTHDINLKFGKREKLDFFLNTGQVQARIKGERERVGSSGPQTYRAIVCHNLCI